MESQRVRGKRHYRPRVLEKASSLGAKEMTTCVACVVVGRSAPEQRNVRPCIAVTPSRESESMTLVIPIVLVREDGRDSTPRIHSLYHRLRLKPGSSK